MEEKNKSKPKKHPVTFHLEDDIRQKMIESVEKTTGNLSFWCKQAVLLKLEKDKNG